MTRLHAHFLTVMFLSFTVMADGLLASIDVPKLGELLVGNAARAHNKIGNESVRRCLVTHHDRRIPLHFARPAHQRYGYAERSPHYRAMKQRRYGSSIDLIETGRTKHAMLSQYQISVGGTAAGGNLRGDLKLRFPFGAAAQAAHARRAEGKSFRVGAPLSARGRRDGKPRVTIDQMRREIAAITPAEASEINQQVRDEYVELVKTTTGARQQVKV